MEATHTIETSPVLLEEPALLSPSREECGVAIFCTSGTSHARPGAHAHAHVRTRGIGILLRAYVQYVTFFVLLMNTLHLSIIIGLRWVTLAINGHVMTLFLIIN